MFKRLQYRARLAAIGLLASCAVWVSLSPRPAIAAPAEIAALQQNSEPKYLEQSPLGKGLCGDIYVRLAERLTAHGVQLRTAEPHFPIKRILKTLAGDTPGIFCGAGRNAEREKRFIYATTPIYHASNIVVARADDTDNPKSIQDLIQTNDVIGVFFGTSSGHFLKSHDGLRVSDRNHDLNQALKDVENGRMRYFYYHDLGLLYLLRTGSYKLRAIPTTFRTVPQWIIMSKSVPTDVRATIDKEITAMVSDGDVTRIWNRYKP